MRIITYGNDLLRKKCSAIDNIDGKLIEQIDAMKVLLKKNKGIGLAAPQVAMLNRVFIIDIPKDITGTRDISEVFINPTIVEYDAVKVPYEEGCLSVPGIYHNVVRPDRVVIQYIGLDGKEYEMQAYGIVARVVQHEIDHLDGILFIDRIPQARLESIKDKLEKIALKEAKRLKNS